MSTKRRFAGYLIVSFSAACTSTSPPAADRVLSAPAMGLSAAASDPSFSDAAGWDVFERYSTMRFPDIDGDARTDVCGHDALGIRCALDDGHGAYANDSLWDTTFTDPAWARPEYYATIAYPDIDGDGKADLCGRGAAGYLCGVSRGDEFAHPMLWSAAFSDAAGWNGVQYYSTLRFADVDGDGRADVCGRGPSGLLCALSDGHHFGAPTSWSPSFGEDAGWALPEYYRTIAFVDLDGDRRADVCGRSAQGMSCALSDGERFGPATLWSDAYSDANGWNAEASYTTIQYGDLNYDGRADVCGHLPTGLICALSTGSSFGAAKDWSVELEGFRYDAPSYALIHPESIRVALKTVCGRRPDGFRCSFVYDQGEIFRGLLPVVPSEESDPTWLDPKYYSTITLTSDLKLASRGPDGAHFAPVYPPDRVSLHTAAEVAERRARLIDKIWLDRTLGTDPPAAEELSDTLLDPALADPRPLPPGVTIHRYTMEMPTSGGIPDGTDRPVVQGLVDHYVPAGGSRALVILNPGHTCRYETLPYQAAQPVLELLAEGYAVLATHMPRHTPLDCATDLGYCGACEHEALFGAADLHPAGGQHPDYYFLEPVRRSLNYVLSRYAYDRVAMSGLSGGGWTTALYSALDPRIGPSVQVAGSEPLDMQREGDAEQRPLSISGVNDFFDFVDPESGQRTVTGYQDLYLMAASGAGRKHVQVLNRHDDMSFGERIYTGPYPTWGPAVRAYEAELRNVLQAMGEGSFRVEINEADDRDIVPGGPFNHEFSKNTRGVIKAELDDSYAYLGLGGQVFARGRDGDVVMNSGRSATWTELPIPLVGTPAVASDGRMTHLFYRDPENQLAHAVGEGRSWEVRADVTGRIISDPVVASSAAGRLDVVAVGSDYAIHHWAFAGSWTVEVVPSAVLAVGALALTAPSADRLDLFFRGHDEVLYHAVLGGSATYPESTGLTVKGGAAAASGAGMPRVFAVGLDDQLYRGTPSEGGSWTWENLASALGMTALRAVGSPAAVVVDGEERVYLRISEPSLGSGLARFTLPENGAAWQLALLASGAFVGSPSANALGAFILDPGHAVLSLDVGFMRSLGGAVDR